MEAKVAKWRLRPSYVKAKIRLRGGGAASGRVEAKIWLNGGQDLAKGRLKLGYVKAKRRTRSGYLEAKVGPMESKIWKLGGQGLASESQGMTQWRPSPGFMKALLWLSGGQGLNR